MIDRMGKTKELDAKIKNKITYEIKDDLYKLLLLSSSESANYKNDIDYIIVLEDKCNLFDILKLISMIGVKLTKEFGIFVSIYPILKKDYLAGNTMFIQNVIQYGQEL
ncbi:MAG: hypothetical protein R3C61_27845 [Bacteroidia bacterium]